MQLLVNVKQHNITFCCPMYKDNNKSANIITKTFLILNSLCYKHFLDRGLPSDPEQSFSNECFMHMNIKKYRIFIPLAHEGAFYIYPTEKF
jgi:hypothetical protein